MDIEKLAVECGALRDIHPKSTEYFYILTPDQLQAFAEAYAEQENYILLGVLADIRIALGVNEKPMLSDLANVAKEVKVENEALKVLLGEARGGISYLSGISEKAEKLLKRIDEALKVSE